MTVETLEIAGCRRITLDRLLDSRGSFLKIYAETPNHEAEAAIDSKEVFYSVSNNKVLRGLHFQTPPHDHAKIVHCMVGRVLDVILDLRRSSPTFGRCLGFELSGDHPVAIFIPPGCAHGFYSLEDNSTLLYLVTSEYTAHHDAGIHWSSVNFDWPSGRPIVSPRDDAFPRLDDFESPFP